MRSLSALEKRALSLLSAYGVTMPTVEEWQQALSICRNAARSNAKAGARDYVGAYGYAKADQRPYKPVVQTGAPSQSEPDALTCWLLKRRSLDVY